VVEANAEEERAPTGVWREMTALGFRGSDTLKKKNSSNGHDDVINDRRRCGYARHYCGYARRY
jgi:hypothetical protein